VLHRSFYLRMTIILTTLSLLVLAARPAPSTSFTPAEDRLKDITNWQELLPEPVFNKIMEESVQSLKDKTKSPSEFNQKYKLVANEAYSLIAFAEVFRRANDGDMAQKAILIEMAAKDLAAAAKGKDLEAAKKQVTVLAGFKKMKDSEVKPMTEPLQELVPIHNLMEQVQAVNKEMIKYKRLKESELKAKNKSDEVLRNAHRLACYSVCITSHVPEKDIPKGKSKEDWLKATDDLRKATLEIASAAKAKNQSNLRAAITKMDSACTKCHDDFRVETK
jgi:hypothetical protein